VNYFEKEIISSEV